MKFGIIGCGKMGFAIADRVVNVGFSVTVFDLNSEHLFKAAERGCVIATSPEALAQEVDVIWLMVPQGEPVDEVLKRISPYAQGKIIVDGGNSNFQDSVRRFHALQKEQIEFLDCGTSGGVHGQELGFSLMIGGDAATFERIEILLQAIAAPEGYAYLGAPGAGHYVKMVHNGIEYALLESYAEGLSLLKEGSYPDLDLAQVTKVWEQGSIIRSWITTLSRQIFEEDQEFDTVAGSIAENATGRWTVEEAKKKNIPVPLIEQSLEIRNWSRQTGGDWRTKLVALLRRQFGGHEVKKN